MKANDPEGTTKSTQSTPSWNHRPPDRRNLSGRTALAIAGGLALMISSASAQWYNPYAAGSTADLQLNFNDGPSGSVTSPDPALVAGIGYNFAWSSVVPGGGWGLRAAGSTAFGVGVPPLTVIAGSSNSRTSVGASALTFDIVTDGLSNLVGVSLPMQWEAASTIGGSESWTPLTDQFRYQFDVLLSNSLVSGSPDVFGGITLNIGAGGSTLYQQTGLANILGITSITSSFYEDAFVSFDYDPLAGPLEITWSANSTISAALLNLLGDGANTMYQVNNGQVLTAVPEPSTYALLLGAASLLFLRRKRRTA